MKNLIPAVQPTDFGRYVLSFPLRKPWYESGSPWLDEKSYGRIKWLLDVSLGLL